MTLEQLKKRTFVRKDYNIPESYQVEILYKGQVYSCKSNNTIAYDRLNNSQLIDCYKLLKTSYQAFYNECKNKNKLK